MNKYGVQAMQMWRDLAPTALAELDDPSSHFSALGEEALEQVTSLAIELQGPDVPGETYFEKVGRIENAKLRAEEIVREELLVPPPEVRDLTEDELDELTPSESQQEIAAMWQLLQSIDDQQPGEEPTTR